MSTKIEADFDEVMEEVNEIVSKQDGFDRLDYFIEVRKLYSLLQALCKGGSLAVNSNLMAKMSKDLMHDHFNRLVQIIFTICGMAKEMRGMVEDIEPKSEIAEEKESEEKVPDNELHVFRDQEIPYVV